MKITKNYKIVTSFIVFTAVLFLLAFNFFPVGYVGTTKKRGENLGCICHGGLPTTSVSVFITGPDSVAVGQTVTYKVSVAHGPGITGGFNVASDTGTVNPVAGDTLTHLIEYPPSSGVFEITQTHPRFFINDTVSWNFTYTAPNFQHVDTLFASGNSTNNDLTSDNDNWNWSNNKPVYVYVPIGIINISTIAKDFALSQNYPNPFNPVTQIIFSVAKSADIQIRVYDILGNLVSEPVNKNLQQGEYKADFNGSSLSSGVYFYTLFVNGEKISTKKMLMLK